MSTDSKNILWLDSLRALATLGVILIHVSAPLVNMAFKKNVDYWWIGNVMDSATRCAVPIFLMLSGATMLGKKYVLKDFYLRRVSRVLIPFLFWMVAYWIFRWSMLPALHRPLGMNAIIDWGIKLLLNEGISKHFWYIYMILFIYLFVPFLAKGIQKLNLHAISNIVFLWAVFTFVLKSVPLNMYSFTSHLGSRLLGNLLYTGYLVLGYYLSVLPTNNRKVKISAGLIYCVTVIVASVVTYHLSTKAHKLDLSMYSYLSTVIIIQSIALFVWVKDCNISNKYILWIQNIMSDYSYGIYLVHIILLGLFYRIGIFWTMAHPAISVPAVAVITIVSSIAVIFILRKIPLGKYVAG
jgi:surface polysaccharide O-acyltransferase-like enzyme